MEKFYNNKVLTRFLLLQPIIDIITSVMMNNFTISITLGMIIRFLFIVYCFVYIIKNRTKSINIYLILGALYCIINIGGNLILKDNFNVFTQGYQLLRMIYYPITLLFLYLYFKKHKLVDNDTYTDIALIVGFSLIVSILTKTSYCSYTGTDDCRIKGIVGFFNSANEYGIVLTYLLGMTIINFINTKKQLLTNSVAIISVVLFLSLLGTKTSYIGLIGVLGGSLVYLILNKIIKKDKNIDIKKLGFLAILIISVIGLTPKLPVYYNLVGKYEYVVEEIKQVEEEQEILMSEAQKQQEIATTLVFNGRDDFVVVNKYLYKNADLFHKLFGLTTQGNYYENQPYTHINERDFHDLYMYYGIIGFILEMLLPVSIIVGIIKNFIKNKNIIFNNKFMITLLVSALILLVSYMAGHALFQPDVSIYLALLLIMLLKNSGEINEENRISNC